MRRRVVVGCILAALLIAAGVLHVDARVVGVCRALWDVKTHHAAIEVYGEATPYPGARDPYTGLPFRAVAGCVVTRRLVVETDAYNSVVALWVGTRPGV